MVFLGRAQKTIHIKGKMDKFSFIKITNICSCKDTCSENTMQTTDWEKEFSVSL